MGSDRAGGGSISGGFVFIVGPTCSHQQKTRPTLRVFLRLR